MHGPKGILNQQLFGFVYHHHIAVGIQIGVNRKDGQMHGLRIGFNVYEDCAGIIRRNPSVKPSPGFSRIDPAWVARFFR